MNKIADYLGLPHWPGSFAIRQFPQEARTWKQFVDEVMGVLPLGDIVNLLFDKLQTSADFQELYTKIQNWDYQKLHDNALKHPEIVDMIKRIEAMGVDVAKLWEMVKSAFGWTYRSARKTDSLKEVFDTIIGMIPVDKIHQIYFSYQNDPDIVKINAYLKSADFAAVYKILTTVEELRDLVSYLDSKDINATGIINRVVDRFGLPHWPTTFLFSDVPHKPRSWKSMVDEMLAVVPMDDILSYVMGEMQTSADLQELYKKIQGWDFDKLEENAKKHPEIVDMVQRMEAMGMDIQKAWDTIKAIFGK